MARFDSDRVRSARVQGFCGSRSFGWLPAHNSDAHGRQQENLVLGLGRSFQRCSSFTKGGEKAAFFVVVAFIRNPLQEQNGAP